MEDFCPKKYIAAKYHTPFTQMFKHPEAKREAILVRGVEGRDIAVDGRLVDAGSDAQRAIRNNRADSALGEVRRADDIAEAIE